ncbi:receptor-like protein 6 [Quercus suber]|uniref:receptor-like protein 6 n=1 Tax=Quercus suber TaxID=58331 RepID=UPI0032DF3B39
MGSSMCPFMSVRLLFFLSMFHFLNSCSSFSTQPLCNASERSALLQFKQSFVINMSVSSDPFAYPKVLSWNTGERNDCCSWDGVQCDEGTGHVIGLDLSSSYLYGSINSSNSLLHLVHLQKLNLADNDFNYSQIPQSIRYLSNCTHLNLSMSLFSSQIPPEIFELSNLVSLDLSFNPLKLQKPNLKSLVENLTSLKLLHLAEVDISSPVPHTLANASSLVSLSLRGCGLYSEFPIEIFKLPNLQLLNVGYNEDLTGYLPEFHNSSPLQILRLQSTSFSRKLPDSIGNLKSLQVLNIFNCSFSGLVPTSLGNLTNLIILKLSSNNFRGKIPFSLANHTQLSLLDLSFNSFSPQTLTWLGKQTKLTLLDLSVTNSYGEIPSSLKNLTQLTFFDLMRNKITGQIPYWLGNLTQLSEIDLGDNQLNGSIPQSISTLVNLEFLSLINNKLSGRVQLDSILKLKNLTSLQLSGVHLSFPMNSTFNSSIPKLQFLILEECNLTEFPFFLRYQHELEYLDLRQNKIQGQIPKWIFNMGKETLLRLSLGFNFLTGFESFSNIPWDSLLILELDSNKLQGLLPIPPPSIAKYIVKNNSITGEISPLFCNLSSIIHLDLSHNNLSGILPQCLSKLSNLLALNLRNNNFLGTLPATYMEQSRLKAIDVSYNQLEGQVPRSLSNCTMLEILVLGNNQFHDIFPSWLGMLPRLKVLILRYNGLHGAIGKPESKLYFTKLQIVDLSFNNFTGKLPSELFQSWTSMKVANLKFERDNVYNSSYMIALTTIKSPHFIWYGYFSYSLEMTNKGIEQLYERIQGVLIAIDLSSNRFEGEISEVIGILNGLHLLNLSNNIFSGHIPSSFGNLKEIESLDLSQNKLLGEIPQQLLQLTFLEVFNVSNNRLSGPIPQGKQFSTFLSDSYLGNTGLCGSPLTKKCKISKTSTKPPPISKQGEFSKFPNKLDWVVIMMGYGSGLIIGFIIGHNLTIRKLERFVRV